MNQEYKERGKRLKAARKAVGITQRDLSEATGEPQTIISRMENGQADISTDVLVYLQRNFDVNSWYILSGSGMMILDETGEDLPAIVAKFEKMQKMFNSLKQ